MVIRSVAALSRYCNSHTNTVASICQHIRKKKKKERKEMRQRDHTLAAAPGLLRAIGQRMATMNEYDGGARPRERERVKL